MTCCDNRETLGGSDLDYRGDLRGVVSQDDTTPNAIPGSINDVGTIFHAESRTRRIMTLGDPGNPGSEDMENIPFSYRTYAAVSEATAVATMRRME